MLRSRRLSMIRYLHSFGCHGCRSGLQYQTCSKRRKPQPRPIESTLLYDMCPVDTYNCSPAARPPQQINKAREAIHFLRIVYVQGRSQLDWTIGATKKYPLSFQGGLTRCILSIGFQQRRGLWLLLILLMIAPVLYALSRTVLSG